MNEVADNAVTVTQAEITKRLKPYVSSTQGG